MLLCDYQLETDRTAVTISDNGYLFYIDNDEIEKIVDFTVIRFDDVLYVEFMNDRYAKTEKPEDEYRKLIEVIVKMSFILTKR